MQTLFLSVGHNWGKNGKNIDVGAVQNGTNEATEADWLVRQIMNRLPRIRVMKVPAGLNLSERIAWINRNLKNAPEPFALEFHLDSGPVTATGASVWYNDTNSYTKQRGEAFLAEYVKITGLRSRGVMSDSQNRLGGLGFVSEVKCASLLIELGFISNPKDLAIVRQKGMEATLAGIRKI